MKKIAVFTGTRAEYGLLYWLLKDIQNDKELTLQLLVSGMHLSPTFGSTYEQIEKDGFHIDEKVEILISSNTSIGTAKSIGLGVIGFADALSRLQPDSLVILGDRFEALAVAQTAMILGIPILHLHGGEITEGAYDDTIRHAISKLSYLHGTSTEKYRQRVIQMGEHPSRVQNIGAVGLDHLRRSTFLTVPELSSSLDFNLCKPYFLVTYHPVTMGDENPEGSYLALLDALDAFTDHQVIFTYPNADNGGQHIIPMLNDYAAKNPSRCLAIPSMGQQRYLSAMKHTAAVIGNSSSGIIEAPSFNVPTVNIGLRQKGRLAAKSVIHCAPTARHITESIKLALDGGYKKPGEHIANPYGAGDASTMVLTMLKSLTHRPVKRFYNLQEA